MASNSNTQPKRDGILLLNIGSPSEPSPKALRSYLAEFLMDKYVLDIPWAMRAFIVYALILPKRPKESAEAYKRIWTEQGSPLVVETEKTVKKLREKTGLPVEMGMRYGTNRIKDALLSLKNQGCEHLHIIPMFPQYASATTEGIVAYTKQLLKSTAPELNRSFQAPFYQDPGFITAVSNIAKPYITSKDHLLFSYHGLPERQLKKTDPTGEHCLQHQHCCETPPKQVAATCYRHQCMSSTEKIVAALKLKPGQYSVAFQSRLGKDPWLSPATDETITALAKSGIKSLKVVCPSFTTDCLETLEEIGIEGRELFLEHGGKDFELIPCLNDSEDWVNTIRNWIQ